MAEGRAYKDLWEHIEELDAAGLLRIDKPINKDTEMHLLVRWQFRGGIPEVEQEGIPVYQCHRQQRPEI